MEFVEFNSKSLINFYMNNGLEIDENRGYFGNDVKSFALINNKQVIGAVSFSFYKTKNYIEAIAVDKEYRNMGYGKILLKKVIKELSKPVYTISKVDRFYLKNGFIYDDSDLIVKECKCCKEYNVTCFPKVVVYK